MILFGFCACAQIESFDGHNSCIRIVIKARKLRVRQNRKSIINVITHIKNPLMKEQANNQDSQAQIHVIMNVHNSAP